jgi:uncharacterized membrane-anchored protein YjiN (DUF445 family)
MSVWLSIWAAVGPLIGVMLGSYLTVRGQRRQWIADNKKQEYSELLTTLSRTVGEVITYHTPPVAHPPHDQLVYDESIKKAATVIIDRIFIAREVQRMELVKRWREALTDLENNDDLAEFANRFHGMLQDITEHAMRIVD